MILSGHLQICSLSLTHTRASRSVALATKRALLLPPTPLPNPSSAHSLSDSFFPQLQFSRLNRSRRICSQMSTEFSPIYSHEDEAEVSKGIRPKPVLLFDVMDTIVRDPFYDDVPLFFGLSMKELLAVKHPTAWIDFERGHLTENQLKEIFFHDGRGFDFVGLKNLMFKGYQYLEGMEELLGRLKVSGYQMHAFTNYPSWYNMIEEKLRLSKYLSWTFVSCHTGLRKPDLQAYTRAIKHLKLHPSDCIFIDDRPRNIESAIQLGMSGFLFRNAGQLEQDLLAAGLKL